MMNCKIDHSDPEAFPAFLCRACHPELIPTTEQRMEYATRVRAARDREMQRQELLRLRAKIASMSRDGEPDPCYVPIKARIYNSLVAKEQRLTAEMEDQAA